MSEQQHRWILMSRRLSALAVLWCVATAAVCQDNRELINRANRLYDKDDYRSSFSLYLDAVKAGPIGGGSWYRMAYSYEQANGEPEMQWIIYAVAKYVLEHDSQSSLYLQYATNKLSKLGAKSLPNNQVEVDALIEQIKMTSMPKEGSVSAPLVAYIIEVILAFLIAGIVGRFLKWPALGAAIFPVLSLLSSLVATGHVFVLGFSIATIALLLIVVTLGGYRHARKDGGADRRFRENPYDFVFSRGSRAMSGWGILGTGFVAIVLGIAFS